MQVRFPKVEENRRAEWEFSKILNEAILDGIPTNREMEKMLRDRKIWTEEDDNKIINFDKQIEAQIAMLEKMTEDKAIEQVQTTINRLRNEQMILQSERQRFFQQTAESKAEEAKLSFLVYKCAMNADTEEPVWKTYEDFKNEEDQITANQIALTFLSLIHGLDINFSAESQEEQEK